ncbi:class I SAM-dependent methyltransferase, partial [Acinetobacter baumannii]
TTKTTLDEAEEFALQIYSERAQLKDGQQILELGCGWGSFTLWMAERYPNASIKGVSNSATQRQHILAQAKQRGLNNI